MKKFSVFIGRFQPFHPGHLKVVQEALDKTDELIIVLGSAGVPSTPRNPFSVEERIQIIKSYLTDDELKRIRFTAVEDHTYNLQRWIGAVQGAVFSSIHTKWESGPTEIFLAGHKKDHSSFYLDLFPTWKSIEVENERNFNSTEIRKQLYEKNTIPYSYGIPESTSELIINIFNKKHGILRREWDKIKKYKDEWGEGPLSTVDAAVVQSGHILLVKRADEGENLWALPGGFINLWEKLEDAMIRELREETGLKVPVPVLKGSIIKQKVYDDPHRSERARIITNAFYIELKNGPLPKVKGNDDAKEARWFSISEFLTMRDKMFEDHYDMITDLIGA